MLDTARRSVR